jgi:hypothetical protein
MRRSESVDDRSARLEREASQRRRLVLWVLDGVAAGWVLLLALVWSDVGRIGTLMDASDHGELSMAMLAAVFAFTFGFWGLILGAIFATPETGR